MQKKGGTVPVSQNSTENELQHSTKKPKHNATPKPILVVFSVLFMLVCVFPFAGLALFPAAISSDDDTLASAPALTTEDGSPNLYLLSQAGEYFEDHFALRNEAIDLNARLRVGLFATSPTNQVIVGQDGWLFYGGTLGDFRADKLLTQREIVNIVHNLELMQGFSEAQGASFVLAIAPNKNTLYPEFMPYYYTQGSNTNMTRLMAAMDDAGINYVDLFALFEAEDEALYYQTDTHWNNEGALLVANEVLDALDLDPATPVGEKEESTIAGDIEKMLYPVTAGTEEAVLIDVGHWSFETANSTVEDGSFNTLGGGEGTLLMYRDSFANNLVELLAPQFEEAHFSKLIPYDLMQVRAMQADVVVVERAERHIDLLAEDAPLMLAPSLTTGSYTKVESASEVEWYQDGDYQTIEGFVDEEVVSNESQIFISVQAVDSSEETAYVPFYVNTQDTNYGFKLHLDEHSLTEDSYTIKVLILDSETQKLHCVLTQKLTR